MMVWAEKPGGLLRLLGVALLASASLASAEVTQPQLRPYAAVGSIMAQNLRLADLEMSESELEAFLDGMRAAARGRPYPIDGDGARTMEQLQQRLLARANVAPAESAVSQYLEQAKQQFQLQQSSSGLLYRLQGGAGPRPRPEDIVVVSFQTRAADGKTELPQLSGKSVRTRVGDLMPALVEALRMMPIGSEAQLVIPPHLSFGQGKWPAGVERGSPLVMRVRLEDIAPQAEP